MKATIVPVATIIGQDDVLNVSFTGGDAGPALEFDLARHGFHVRTLLTAQEAQNLGLVLIKASAIAEMEASARAQQEQEKKDPAKRLLRPVR